MDAFFVAEPLRGGVYWGGLPPVFVLIGFAVALIPIASMLPASLYRGVLRQVMARRWVFDGGRPPSRKPA